MLTHLEHAFREFAYGLRRSMKSHLAPVVLMGVALFILGLFLVFRAMTASKRSAAKD